MQPRPLRFSKSCPNMSLHTSSSEHINPQRSSSSLHPVSHQCASRRQFKARRATSILGVFPTQCIACLGVNPLHCSTPHSSSSSHAIALHNSASYPTTPLHHSSAFQVNSTHPDTNLGGRSFHFISRLGVTTNLLASFLAGMPKHITSRRHFTT